MKNRVIEEWDEFEARAVRPATSDPEEVATFRSVWFAGFIAAMLVLSEIDDLPDVEFRAAYGAVKASIDSELSGGAPAALADATAVLGRVC